MLEEVGGLEQPLGAEARSLDGKGGQLASVAHGAAGGVGDGRQHGYAAGVHVQLEQLGGPRGLPAEHVAEDIVPDRTLVDDAGQDAGIEVIDVGHEKLL